MITRQVTASEAGKRLHRYVRSLLPNVPLGHIYKMIDQGKVRVSGKRKKQNYELQAGDELQLHMEEAEFQEASKGGVRKKPKFVGVRTDLDVIFEDGELLVASKPVGLLTHPDQAQQKDTLIGRVHAYLYHRGELDSTLFLPAAANRLDRNTSGLIVIGKTAGMLHQLNQWNQQRALHKYYVTIAEGSLTGEGEMTGALIRDERNNQTRVVKKPAEAARLQPLQATTLYRALQSGPSYSLVELELISGRTHQIRAHMRSIGHPLAGDLKYGGRKLNRLNHQLLHAWRIVLPDGREFRAPLPQLFRQTLEQVGLQWDGTVAKE